MQIVIDISEKTKDFFDNNTCMNDTNWATYLCELIIAFRNGKPLPAGHGRLIDADALEIPSEEMISRMVIHHAPTIIEADGGAE